MTTASSIMSAAAPVPPQQAVPYGVQKHLLETSLITKDQYEGLSVKAKAGLASTDWADVRGAVFVLEERFKVDFNDSEKRLSADIAQTNAMDVSHARPLFKLLSSIFSSASGSASGQDDGRPPPDGPRSHDRTVLYPWRKCCLGVAPEHRVVAATACQPTLVVRAIDDAWKEKD